MSLIDDKDDEMRRLNPGMMATHAACAGLPKELGHHADDLHMDMTSQRRIGKR